MLLEGLPERRPRREMGSVGFGPEVYRCLRIPGFPNFWRPPRYRASRLLFNSSRVTTRVGLQAEYSGGEDNLDAFSGAGSRDEGRVSGEISICVRLGCSIKQTAKPKLHALNYL